jgi:hypothetical protein
MKTLGRKNRLNLIEEQMTVYNIYSSGHLPVAGFEVTPAGRI